MNNLSEVGLAAKANDLAQILVPTYVPWFSNYLVVKRAAQVGGLWGRWVE
jgi:hypothetical protein